MNEIRAGIDGIELDARARLEVEVNGANQIAARVAEINTLNREVGGALPADLADELDRSLDSLASSLGATAEFAPDGKVRVTVRGTALVDSNRAIPLVVPDSPMGQVDHPTGPIVLGGTAGGLQTAIQGEVAGYRSKLDTFVTSMVQQLNDLHGGGFTADGTPGGELFQEIDGRVVVQITDPSELAASDASDAPLGAKIADQLAQLRSAIGGSYRDVVTHVSNTVATLNRSVATAQTVADTAIDARDAAVGVNMDEELTNMMSEQRAYQAAARVITVVDEMMQTLLAM